VRARIAVALLTCAACAGAPALRPVPPDGGGWRELRSEHFVLRTDLPSSRARRLAAELEAVVDGLRRGLFGERTDELSLSVDVVVFESERDLELFLPENAQAYMWPDPRSSRLTIVMKGAHRERQRAEVAHELTHALLAASHPRQPRWFQEGVACYAETIGWEGPDGNVTLGQIPPWRQWSDFPPSAAAIRALLLERGRLDTVQYSLAWGLVHHLIHRRGEEFRALQERFAEGEDPQQAWRSVFPRWDPEVTGGAERLRDELWSYLSGPMQYHRHRVRRPEGAPHIVERPLSPWEVHDLRLGLPWVNGGRPLPDGLFAAELEAALASGSISAAWIRAQRAPADAVEVAERATREHPSDARAWLLLGAVSTEPAGAEAALRRAVEMDPSSAAARAALARHHLQSGRAREALPHGNEAVRLAPWNALALETLGAVAQALGRCDEALLLQRRAVENLGESDRAGQLERSLDRLAAIEQACAPRVEPVRRPSSP
jgi:tetratricopeptide (TPR) repeat protein